jgi:hypothetical protein
MTMRSVAAWVVGGTLLCACGTAGGQQNQAAQPSPSANWATPAVPTSSATPDTPAAPAANAPPVTAQWLAGRWQMGGGACQSAETQFSFQPDGRYALGEEHGRWTLAGTALTLEVTQAPEDGGVTAGERHTSQVAAINADTAELRTANIPPVRLQRCR